MTKYRKKSSEHRSKLEDRLAQVLKNKSVKYKYEAESYEVWVELPDKQAHCAACGSKALEKRRSYTPDFFLDNGVVIEAKGKFTADNRRIIEAFLEQHPDVDFRMIFQRDNPVRSGAKSRYSDWCKKRQIPYHIGEDVPDGWTTKKSRRSKT